MSAKKIEALARRAFRGSGAAYDALCRELGPIAARFAVACCKKGGGK